MQYGHTCFPNTHIACKRLSQKTAAALGIWDPLWHFWLPSWFRCYYFSTPATLAAGFDTSWIGVMVQLFTTQEPIASLRNDMFQHHNTQFCTQSDPKWTQPAAEPTHSKVFHHDSTIKTSCNVATLVSQTLMLHAKGCHKRQWLHLGFGVHFGKMKPSGAMKSKPKAVQVIQLSNYLPTHPNKLLQFNHLDPNLVTPNWSSKTNFEAASATQCTKMKTRGAEKSKPKAVQAIQPSNCLPTHPNKLPQFNYLHVTLETAVVTGS